MSFRTYAKLEERSLECGVPNGRRLREANSCWSAMIGPAGRTLPRTVVFGKAGRHLLRPKGGGFLGYALRQPRCDIRPVYSGPRGSSFQLSGVRDAAPGRAAVCPAGTTLRNRCDGGYPGRLRNVRLRGPAAQHSVQEDAASRLRHVVHGRLRRGRHLCRCSELWDDSALARAERTVRRNKPGSGPPPPRMT